MKKHAFKRKSAGARTAESEYSASEALRSWPLSPDAGKRIDLHGKKRFQAREIVEAQLRSCRSERCRSVTFICGKGLHSPEGGVLENEVRECLAEMKDYFKNFEADGSGNIRVILEDR